jgi:hypothetical protein
MPDWMSDPRQRPHPGGGRVGDRQPINRRKDSRIPVHKVTQVDAVDVLALLTANPYISAYRREQGYRHERRKFAAAGMAELDGELARAPRAAECPVQLECRLEAATPLAGNEGCTAFEVTLTSSPG